MHRSLAPALALLATLSCSPVAGNESANQAGAEPAGPRPAATIAIVPASGGACTASWDGEVVSSDAVLERGVVALERGIEAVGGPALVTEHNIPFVRLEAPGNATFACIGPTINALQRAGYFHVALRPAPGLATVDEAAYFMIEGDVGADPVLVAVGPGERRAWNGEAVTADQLTERVRANGGSTVPGDYVVVPTADATFAVLVETFAAGADGGAQMSLATCAQPGAAAGGISAPC